MSDPTAVILKGVELFNRGEYEASLATLPPEIVWDTSAAVLDGSSYRGREEVLAYWRDVGERWDDFSVHPDRAIEGEGVVLVLGTLTARGVDSGVPVESTWDQVWTIENGRPVRCDNYMDRAQAWRAAGMEPQE